MAGVVQFREPGRRKLAKTMALLHWICIVPSFICLIAALYIQISIEDKIFFIENYNGAILPGVLVFTGFFGLFTHILSGKVAFANSRIEKRKKWAVFLLPVAIVTFIVFLAELVSGAMCFIHVADLGESFDAGIKVAMTAYKNDVTTKEQMDVLQMSYDCCGSKSYRDWFNIHWIHTDYIPKTKIAASQGRHTVYGDSFTYDDVPFSCCDPEVLRPCIHHHVLDNSLHYNYDHRTRTTLHETGCTDRLMAFYEDSVLILIGALVMGLSFIQLFTTVGCRYLQTAIQGAMDLDDPEGPSEGYLFIIGKKHTRGMDDTATTDETGPLLDTTAETQETSFDTDDRHVQIVSDVDEAFDVVEEEPHYVNLPESSKYNAAYTDDVNVPYETASSKSKVYNEAFDVVEDEPHYVNLPYQRASSKYNAAYTDDVNIPYKTASTKSMVYNAAYADDDRSNIPPPPPPPPLPGEDHTYHDDEVEKYLALRFANSRDKFEAMQNTSPTEEQDGNDNNPSSQNTTNNGDDEPNNKNARKVTAILGRKLGAGRSSSIATTKSSSLDKRQSTHKAMRHSSRTDSDTQMWNNSSACKTISSSRRHPRTGRHQRNTVPPVPGYPPLRDCMTEVRSNHGSYMSMNVSNSSSSVQRRGERPRGPTVYNHTCPSPVSMDSQPYVINMKKHKSPHSSMSPLRRSPAKIPHESNNLPQSQQRLSTVNKTNNVPNPSMSHETLLSERMRRRSDRVIRPFVLNARPDSPLRSYPPRHKRPTRPADSVTVHGALNYGESNQGLRSPSKRPDTSVSAFVPYIYSTFSRIKKGDSPKRPGSPDKKSSPEKVGFKSGISYGCNHYM